MFLWVLVILSLGLRVESGDSVIRNADLVHNTTAAATNIESTIGTPAILVDPTLMSSQNTTDGQYEVRIFFLIPACLFDLSMFIRFQHIYLIIKFFNFPPER